MSHYLFKLHDVTMLNSFSGSDAEYLPIAIARALQPETQNGRKIVNIVSQLKEIGAGTNSKFLSFDRTFLQVLTVCMLKQISFLRLVAANGDYFSTHAALYGRIPDGVTKLNGFDESSLEGVSIPARKSCGAVLNASAIAKEIAEKQPDAYPIHHGVFGGKTGLRDTVMPGSTDAGSTSLGVVDACQGRFSLDELHSWLEQDSIVLFTGSKFYQAPPFCGAVFIPKRIAEKLRNAPPPSPMEMYGRDSLGGFFSDKELSACFESWMPLLRGREGDANNVGLALRWEAGLEGMEKLAKTPSSAQTKAVDDWAASVTKMVQDNQDQLDAWCVERSIVSIRLKKDGGSDWLNMSELRDVYRYMSKDVSSAVSQLSPEEKEALSTRCFIGQPVDVADTHAILRIALGAESLSNYLANPTSTLREDEMAVRKLAAIAKHFSSLKQSTF
jgi:hypothetical protein